VSSSARTHGRVRLDSSDLPPGNFITDATVRLSHGRPSGHRPIVCPSVIVRMTTLTADEYYRGVDLRTAPPQPTAKHEIAWGCLHEDFNAREATPKHADLAQVYEIKESRYSTFYYSRW
jgi:hypothetical protein